MEITKGTTSKIIEVFILDSSSTTGAGKTGLAWDTSGLTWYYSREDQGDVGGSSVTLATMTRGTWASGGFVEKDATNLPGIYQIGIPNAVLVTGASWATMELKGASGMAPLTIRIVLTDDPPAVNVTHWKGTTAPDPATVSQVAAAILVTPANKLVTDASGQVTVGALMAAAITAASIQDDAITAAKLAADATAEIAGSILVTPAQKIVTDANGYVTFANVVRFKKNTAFGNFKFLMVDSTDHITPILGRSVTAQRVIDGGTLDVCANSVVEVGNGIYRINLAATDLNGDDILFLFTATGADPVPLKVILQP